jgi:hypothetical protein
MALMPEEEPVVICADSAQYSAKLVNMAPGGALISILDCDLQSKVGDICQLFFSDGDRMFGVSGKVMRKSGRYAAFKFVAVTNDTARNIRYKISRMESLSHRLTMGVDIFANTME